VAIQAKIEWYQAAFPPRKFSSNPQKLLTRQVHPVRLLRRWQEMVTESTTKDLVRVMQAAKILGVSIVTIYRWARTEPPIIGSEEIAGFLFIPKSEVERLQKARAPR
jgi:hypothetical protein